MASVFTARIKITPDCKELVTAGDIERWLEEKFSGCDLGEVEVRYCLVLEDDAHAIERNKTAEQLRAERDKLAGALQVLELETGVKPDDFADRNDASVEAVTRAMAALLSGSVITNRSIHAAAIRGWTQVLNMALTYAPDSGAVQVAQGHLHRLQQGDLQYA